jgi:sec-independent protein translocase protein TatA
MLGNIGPTEIIIILVIIIAIFGAGKLPEIGTALGKGIRNFKDTRKDAEKEVEKVKEEVKAEVKEKIEEKVGIKEEPK